MSAFLQMENMTKYVFHVGKKNCMESQRVLNVTLHIHDFIEILTIRELVLCNAFW